MPPAEGGHHGGMVTEGGSCFSPRHESKNGGKRMYIAPKLVCLSVSLPSLQMMRRAEERERGVTQPGVKGDGGPRQPTHHRPLLPEVQALSL